MISAVRIFRRWLCQRLRPILLADDFGPLPIICPGSPIQFQWDKERSVSETSANGRWMTKAKIYLLMDHLRFQLCFANLETNGLLAYFSRDILHATWCGNGENFFAFGYAKVQCICVVVVFAGLPVSWPISTTAFQLFSKMEKLLEVVSCSFFFNSEHFGKNAEYFRKNKWIIRIIKNSKIKKFTHF